MKYYKQLDGLRAVAIVGVLIAHWLQNSLEIKLLKNIPYGTGVTLFFVISGFLITKIILDFKEENREANRSNSASIKAFYIRRSLRIFPIYYLTIFFLLFIGFANTNDLFVWLVTYTTNIYMTLESTYIGSFTHFWSLAVEEQFYLMWVFVIVFINKKYNLPVILLFIVISLFFMYYFRYFTEYWLANSLVICQMHNLGSGALLAYFVKYKPEFFKKLSIKYIKLTTLIVLIVFTFIYVVRKPEPLYESLAFLRNPILTLIYFLLVLIGIKNGFRGISKFLLENKISIYIGKISYGLYVYHLFMNPLFFNVINPYVRKPLTNYQYFLVFLVMNLVISTLSWYIIEKPLNSLKKYFKY